MKILVVGSGGREHALVWALVRHGHRVLCAPGNPGMAELAECVPVKVDDLDGQARLAAERGVDLVIVGPEAPLVAGLGDAIRAKGIPCFGPSRDGARLEGSKAFTKRFFARHGIPTADFEVCTSMAEVDQALARLGGDVVVKADGLAAGKGVVVCGDAGEAREAARRMIEDGIFGDSGRTVVIERKLAGREASIFGLSDGKRFALLASAEDHKAVGDGDAGPNTGGMGVLSPNPIITDEVLARVRREVFEPTVRGLVADGIDYRGVLFAGLMIAPDGTPNMLEYNCRFGDPETEPLMVRWDGDPAPWFAGAAAGQLPSGEPPFTDGAAVCVILAAENYPATPRTGDEIHGLAEAALLPNVVIFHAGTRADGQRLLTSGGRILAVTALGEDPASARATAYGAVAKISWPGLHYRRDIGARSSAKE
jgi:phosphoribosylamine---glycine ligase